MKKLFMIIIFCFLLITMLAVSVFAANGQNVAIGAETSVNYPRWSIDPSKLVDGDRSIGCASNQSCKDMDYYIELDNEYTISELIVVVNGIGSYPTDGAFTWHSPSNNEFWFEVRTYDAQGNQTYIKGANHSTRDQNENYEVIFDTNEAKVKSITVYVVQLYNNCVGIWEVEAYEHVCQFDILSETLKKETCVDVGKGIYKCECGKTEERDIPASGMHEYVEVDSLTYENGFLANGLKKMGCPTCTDYIEYDTKPLFKFLGYSISVEGKSICVGYDVNKEAIDEYEKANSTTVQYGLLCAVSDNVNPIAEDGTVIAGINGQARMLKNEAFSRFDIKLTANDWSKAGEAPLVMCAYIIDGSNISYICSETNTQAAIPFCYNQLFIQPI